MSITKDGRRSVVFNRNDGYTDLSAKIACGQCIGCRLERSRQWAIRCVHEASLYKRNCFLTLTYSDENLPAGGTLVKAHFQKFMKRLRRKEWRDALREKRKPADIRYFQCGEYGDTTRRPHYHAIIFGIDFPDQKFHSRNVQGDEIRKSQLLDELWGLGQCTIGKVNFKTAAYVARYIVKKITGEAAEKHYRVVDPQTGETIDRQPEYITMSLKPGIGARWYAKYKEDVHADDSIVQNGKEQPTLKFYDRLYKRQDPDALDLVKQKRVKKARKYASNNTRDRLAVRKELTLARISTLKRSLE